ncbi:MAG: hypothetical protein RL689_708, partial [Planctomycetota bacterium]
GLYGRAGGVSAGNAKEKAAACAAAS